MQNKGLQAANEVRAEVVKLLNETDLSLEDVIKSLRDELSALETKAQYDQKSGDWQYSKDLIAHNIRIQAIKIALELHDAKPSEKREVKHDLSGLMAEVVGAALKGSEDEQSGD